MKKQSRAYVFALLTVLFWATAATAFKIALRDLNNIQLLFIANLTSLIVIFSFLLLSGKWVLLKTIKLNGLALSALQGFLNPFAYYIVIFKAYTLLPAQIAQPVNFIWPVVLFLLSVPILRQPLKATGLLSLLVSFGGVFVLAGQGNLHNFHIEEPAGIILALSSSVIWAIFWLINVRDKRDDIVKLFMSFGFSMVYIILVAVTRNELSDLLSKPWIPAIYVGLFEMGITFILWLKALTLSESTAKVANLIYLTPFMSLLVIHFVLGEDLMITSVLGLCLIVAGIFIGRIKNNN
jgi:drug/metabolite transporter (DMT)-like permease